MIDDNDLPTLDYYQARVEFFKTLLSPIPLEKIHDFVSEIQNNLINPFCDVVGVKSAVCLKGANASLILWDVAYSV